MCNAEIRQEMKKCGVRQWQVAEALGMSEGLLSRKMRRELDPETKEAVLSAIDRIVSENAQAKIQSAGSRFVVEK